MGPGPAYGPSGLFGWLLGVVQQTVHNWLSDESNTNDGNAFDGRTMVVKGFWPDIVKRSDAGEKDIDIAPDRMDLLKRLQAVFSASRS